MFRNNSLPARSDLLLFIFVMFCSFGFFFLIRGGLSLGGNLFNSVAEQKENLSDYRATKLEISHRLRPELRGNTERSEQQQEERTEGN